MLHRRLLVFHCLFFILYDCVVTLHYYDFTVFFSFALPWRLATYVLFSRPWADFLLLTSTSRRISGSLCVFFLLLVAFLCISMQWGKTFGQQCIKKKCFKQKLSRIKFPTRSSVVAYLHLPNHAVELGMTHFPIYGGVKNWLTDVKQEKPLCVLIEDVDLWTYGRYTRHLFDSCIRCLQIERLKKLLYMYSKNLFKKISFMGEKIFTIEQRFNKQNDKVYTWTLYETKSKNLQNSKRSLPIFYDGVVRSVVKWGHCDSFLKLSLSLQWSHSMILCSRGNAGSSNKIQHQLTSQSVVKNSSQTMILHLFKRRAGHLVAQI